MRNISKLQMAPNWTRRFIHLDSYKEYCNHPTAFTLKINHGGQLTCPPNVRYIGGKANWFNDVDADTFSIIDKTNNGGPSESNPAKRACESNAGKSFSESNDGKRGSGSSNVKRPSGSNKGKRPIVIEDDDGSDSSEYSGDSEDSDDSDFDIGDEDIIGDVDVDMDDFRKHTDENVEWTECTEKEQVPPPFDYEEVDLEEFGSGTESDDPECERKRALKKLAKAHRPVDGLVYSDNFYIGQCLANKTLIKEMVSKIVVAQRRQLWLSRNEKLRMTEVCRGKKSIGKCTASFLSKEIEEAIKPDPRVPIASLKDQLQRKYELGLSDMKIFRAKTNGQKKTLLGPYPGQILTAVGVDPNNGIYPLAYAVVEGETKESWLWFLDCLGDDLELFRNSNFTFISDRQKVPWWGELFKDLLWEKCNVQQFRGLERIWKRSRNLSEMYNWLYRIATQHCASHTSRYKVIWNGGDLYDTTGPHGDKCVVNITLRSCACRKWEITGMPCKHAVASIWDMANNGLEPGIPESWVHESYWLKTWVDMYRFKVNPCNGPELWPESDTPITLTAPNYKPPIGRPKKKRRKSAAEIYDNLVKRGR
ncbi:mutator type transposase [Tanacetum coccineum]